MFFSSAALIRRLRRYTATDDILIRMSILKKLSRSVPMDVPEISLDVLTKIRFHNFVDEFLSRKKQKATFA